jgi:hypothetical protein
MNKIFVLLFTLLLLNNTYIYTAEKKESEYPLLTKIQYVRRNLLQQFQNKHNEDDIKIFAHMVIRDYKTNKQDFETAVTELDALIKANNTYISDEVVTAAHKIIEEFLKSSASSATSESE